MGKKPQTARTEIWKPYPKNPILEVSTEGKVRKKTQLGYSEVKPRFKTADSNYYVITVKTGVIKSLKTVVWETFRGEVPRDMYVTTINGAKTMCDLWNLKLAKMGSHKTSRGNKKVRDKKTGIVYPSMQEFARRNYVANSTVSRAVRGIKSHCDIEVEFVENEPIIKPKRSRGRPMGSGYKKVIDRDTGIIYDSVIDCAKALNISQPTVSKYCRDMRSRKYRNLEFYEVI